MARDLPSGSEMRAFRSNINIFYLEKTGRIFNWVPDCFKEDFLSLKLAKQITLGYALMFFLMVLISGFSIYSIYRLDKDASNIKGRYSTLSSLISDQKSKPQVYFSDDMLTEAIRIADEQVKYAYITIFTVVGIVLVFGGALTFIVPRVITRPILRLADAAQKVASGNLSHRVESLDGSSEISMLTQAFNNMLESIEYHEKELEKKNAENLKLLDKMKRFNEVLEIKIEEATKEIREKQEELIKSEKLAAIGELATNASSDVCATVILSGTSPKLEARIKKHSPRKNFASAI